MSRRSILFLQGNATWFFRRLGKALARRGHHVRRVNFCAGDHHFWGDWNAIEWREGLVGLEGFLEDLIRSDGTDAIALFGDCRPIHRVAIAVAVRLGVEVLVFEEGYLRPHWITLETGGVNGNSRLPDDPEWYLKTAAALAPEASPHPVGSGMRERVLYDFLWQFGTLLGAAGYPGYRTHRPYPILAEYASWARRLSTLKWRKAQARAEVLKLGGDRSFFLLPLQLDSDSQIRAHSPFDGMVAAIDAVLADFACNADPADALVIKAHPLDNGWIDYRRHVRRAARRLGIGRRVCYIDGGDLDALIAAARGTVTVNSTAGFTAIAAGQPTICLGRAIYDVPGLTNQGTLAQFWQVPEPPSADLYDIFARVVTATCLVNGNFYTPRGMVRAVSGCVARIESPVDLLATAPPREPHQNRLSRVLARLV